MTTVHQVVPVLEGSDATADDLRAIRDRLRARGTRSEVYVLERRANVADEVHPLDDLLTEPAPDAVLYHFSIGSPITPRLVATPRLPVVLKHHNTTPERYFRLVDRIHHSVCREARRDLPRLRGHVRLALADSDYSRRELDALGFAPTGVLPLILDPRPYREHRPGPLAEELRRAGHVFLCVGRIAPNKRIEDAIRALHAYRHAVDPTAQLWIVGDASRLPRYRDALERLAARLGVGGVRFAGRLPDEQLRDCYHGARVLLSVSEHEGFCKPLLEAMLCDLPIVARAAAAIPETLGGAGVLVEGRDPLVLAEAMARGAQDETLRAALIERGRRRAEELRPDAAFEALATQLRGIGVQV